MLLCREGADTFLCIAREGAGTPDVGTDHFLATQKNMDCAEQHVHASSPSEKFRAAVQ